MMRFLETRLNMLRILSRYADLKSRKALAEGLCLSKINYCICLWATTTGEVLDKIQVIQNDVVRAVYGIGRKIFQNLDPLYEKLKWTRIRQTIQYHDVITLNSILTHDTPRDIATKFSQKVNHTHNTRGSKKNFRITDATSSKNTVKDKGFVCRSARHYLELPELITESKLIPRHAFKDSARSHFGGWPTKMRTQLVTWWLEERKLSGNRH